MKKYISYLSVIAVALFFGIAVSNATSIAQYVTINKDYECTTKVVGDKKYTTCDIKGVAKETTTLSGEENWEITYEDNTLSHEVKIDSSNGLGFHDNLKTDDNGGSFTFTYSGNITKGQTVTLFTIEFITDNISGKKCGGFVSPKGTPDNGNSKTDNSDQTVDDEPTGVSIPAAVIGIGTITGLAIYSVASRKTKMHRI